MSTNRPFGVTLIAFLALLSGLWGILKGLALLGVGGLAAGLVGGAHPMAGLVLWGLAATFGVVALVVGGFALAFAWGAWHLRRWAWGLGVATAVLSLAWVVVAALGPGTLRGRIWEIVMNGVLLYYLGSPDVRRAFGRG